MLLNTDWVWDFFFFILTLDCVSFASICYTVAEYQCIVAVQEIGHWTLDCFLKKLGLSCVGPKYLKVKHIVKDAKNVHIKTIYHTALVITDSCEGEFVNGHANASLTALHGGRALWCVQGHGLVIFNHYTLLKVQCLNQCLNTDYTKLRISTWSSLLLSSSLVNGRTLRYTVIVFGSRSAGTWTYNNATNQCRCSKV